MGKARKHTSEQIVNILRQIEVAVANGKTHPVASREAGITEQDLLPLAQGVRRPEGGSGQAAQGTGAGEQQGQVPGS